MENRCLLAAGVLATPAQGLADAGDPNFHAAAFDPALYYDQRGLGYNRIADAQIDIGAYEQADFPPETLQLVFADSTVSEADGSVATTATITRTGDLSGELVVTLTNPDPSELYLPQIVTLPAGQASVSLDVAVVNDGEIDGDQTVVVNVAGEGYPDNSDTITVADDDVTGALTLGGHLTGTIDEGTYHVLFDIEVDAGETLTIAPGSRLEFAPNVKLAVQGRLLADAHAGSEIVLTSDQATPDRGDWRGVSINSADSASILDHVEIAYAYDAVQVIDGSATNTMVTISNSSIHGSHSGVYTYAIASYIGGDQVQVLNNRIYDNGTGVISRAHAITCSSAGNSARIRGNEIYENGTGIGLSATTSGGCIPARSSSVGSQVSQNFIHHNNLGIRASTSQNSNQFLSVSGTIFNNVIANNAGHGIEFPASNESIFTSVLNNTIVDNSGAGIFHRNVTQNGFAIRNNIIVGNLGGIEASDSYTPTEGVVAHNLVDDNGASNFINYPAGFGDLSTANANGTPADAEMNISIAPQFVGSGTAVQPSFYHLRITSPAIDAGIADGAPTDDFDGLQRTVVPDIGSFERVNASPTDLVLSSTSVGEEHPVGTVVGALSTADADADDLHTYALVAGPGDEGNAAFTVDGDQLKTATVLDFETQSSYSIRLQATDFHGEQIDKIFTVTVIDLGAAAVITGINSGPLLYRQDQPPLPVAPAAVIADPENTGFDGSQLRVLPLSTPQAGDRWLLRNTSDVTIDGDAVVVGGVTVGIRSGDSSLVVDFNSSATLEAVQETLRAVAFLHEGKAPNATIQEAAITLGGGSLAPSDPVQVSVTKWNRPDRPLIEGLGSGVHYIEGTVPLTLADPAAFVSDPDAHADFGASKLTARMVRNADSFDRLSILSTGDGAGEVRVDGTTIHVGGTVVGELTQDGVATTPLQVVFNDAASEESVTAVLQAVQYQSIHQNLRLASKDVRFDLVDPHGISAVPVYKLVTLETVNDPAVLSGIDGTSVIYNENALPRTVASGTVLSDPDYNGGGSLMVAITGGGESGDRLRVLHQGMGTNQVGVESNRVYFSGQQVGTISGGIGTNPLVVTLNSHATAAAVGSIARVVQFWNTSEQPAETTRTLAYTFNDGAGATTSAQTASVVVNSINDTTVIANLGDDLTTTSGGAPIQVSTSVTISDVDSANFDGGLFRVRIASGESAADLLSIRHVGSGPDQIAVSGNEVYWSGVLIGTFAGGSSGSVLQVTLNGDATPLAVQRLARNILFSTSGAAGNRQIEFQVWDGDGANTVWMGKTISVSPTPTLLAVPPIESSSDDKEEQTLEAYTQSVDEILLYW